MEEHYELNDREFEDQFSSCSLNPSLFSHEAHLRLAWIHIRKYGCTQAITNITSQLQQFVTFLGARDKYNETVTVAAVKAVNHFMVKSRTENFLSFISENPRLKSSFRELLGYHYITDIFVSEKAKKEFLEPELLPFD